MFNSRLVFIWERFLTQDINEDLWTQVQSILIQAPNGASIKAILAELSQSTSRRALQYKLKTWTINSVNI